MCFAKFGTLESSASLTTQHGSTQDQENVVYRFRGDWHKITLSTPCSRGAFVMLGVLTAVRGAPPYVRTTVPQGGNANGSCNASRWKMRHSFCHHIYLVFPSRQVLTFRASHACWAQSKTIWVTPYKTHLTSKTYFLPCAELKTSLHRWGTGGTDKPLLQWQCRISSNCNKDYYLSMWNASASK